MVKNTLYRRPFVNCVPFLLFFFICTSSLWSQQSSTNLFITSTLTHAYVGGDFWLSKKWGISTHLGYKIPMRFLFSGGDEYKISYFRDHLRPGGPAIKLGVLRKTRKRHFHSLLLVGKRFLKTGPHATQNFALYGHTEEFLESGYEFGIHYQFNLVLGKKAQWVAFVGSGFSHGNTTRQFFRTHTFSSASPNEIITRYRYRPEHWNWWLPSFQVGIQFYFWKSMAKKPQENPLIKGPEWED